MTICRTSPTTRQPLSTHYNIIISSWDTFPGALPAQPQLTRTLQTQQIATQKYPKKVSRNTGQIMSTAHCSVQTDRSGDCSTAAAITGLHAAEWSCSWRRCDHSEYFYGNRNISLESWHQSRPASPRQPAASNLNCTSFRCAAAAWAWAEEPLQGVP